MYQVVLFVHLVSIAFAFLAMGAMIGSLVRLCSARTVAEARGAIGVASKVEHAMPVVTVLLLVTGGYMTQSRWNWATPWIDLSIAGLIAVTALGAAVIGGRARALDRALAAAGDEQLHGELLACVRDPVLIAASCANIGLVCSVMFVMVVKPTLWGGAAALAVGAGLGLLTGRLNAPRPSVDASSPTLNPIHPSWR